MDSGWATSCTLPSAIAALFHEEKCETRFFAISKCTRMVFQPGIVAAHYTILWLPWQVHFCSELFFTLVTVPWYSWILGIILFSEVVLVIIKDKVIKVWMIARCTWNWNDHHLTVVWVYSFTQPHKICLLSLHHFTFFLWVAWNRFIWEILDNSSNVDNILNV